MLLVWHLWKSEEYPRPKISRSDAVKHNEYLKKAIAEGVFDEENKKDGRPRMTRERANEKVKKFNPEDYPDNVDFNDDKMRCSVFGIIVPFIIRERFWVKTTK